jgi:CheY-like chemotaxis protein
MENKILFTWSEGHFAGQLANIFGEDCVIHSAGQLQSRDFSSFAGIVVLAEIKWNGKNHTDFYGFEIIRELRVQRRILCPIIVCSFLPEEYFLPPNIEATENRKSLLFNILKAPGHSFARLPFDFRQIAKSFGSPISEELLDDIIESLCDVEGLLREELQGLKNQAILISQMGPEVEQKEVRNKFKKAIETKFERINFILPYEPGLEKIKQRLWEEFESKVFKTNNLRAGIEIVGSFSGELQRLVPTQQDLPAQKLSEKPKWKILFIDDEENVRKRVKKEFETRNYDCEIVSSADEAYAILDKDSGTNWFTVVIADYRLIKNQASGKWQEKQGYSILKDIYLNKPNMLSFFALSAASRKAFLRIEKDYQMRVFVYSKEDVLNSTGSFNIFTEKVREEGERIFGAVCSQPTLTSWNKKAAKFQQPLKQYYRTHRLSRDYESAEEKISAEAKIYINRIQQAISQNTEPGSHSFDFQAELKGSPENLKILEKFRIKLIGRRIALALHLREGLTREAIYYAMQKNPIINTRNLHADKKTKGKINQLLSTHFALSFETDMPNHLLVEEKSWLNRDMQIDLDQLNRDAFAEIEGCLSLFQDELGSECPDPFIDKEIRVLSLESARKYLQEAHNVARLFDAEKQLRRLIRESWKNVRNNEYLKFAFRVSGAEKLFMEYGD